MSLDELYDQLYFNKQYSEIENAELRALCPSEQKYRAIACKYYMKNQCKYNNAIGKICQMNDSTYYSKLFEYSLQHMRPYPYHLMHPYYFNVLIHSDKVSPADYYKMLIKKLLSEGLPFDRLPAFTARDVFQHLGIARNKFTEMANKYKAEKKKLLTRRPVPQFELSHIGLYSGVHRSLLTR